MAEFPAPSSFLQMTRIGHVPLLANIRIDDARKLELFQVTSRDMAEVFTEAHFKIRGRLAASAIEHLQTLGFDRLRLCQDLPEDDWVATTLQILEGIHASSLFLYFEDHRLVAKPEQFKAVVEDFDSLKLDYLGYSFFRASRLDENNLLPFATIETPNLRALSAGPDEIQLLGKVSPTYYTYSLVSLVSVNYFAALLAAEDSRVKLYSKKMLGLLAWIFPYPKYRQVYARLNRILARVGIRCCIYDPTSPFNLERMWWEPVLLDGRLQIGIPKQELFANYDDDNGAPGESLIKRGLYPFRDMPTLPLQAAPSFVERSINLSQGERLDLHYHSAAGRISTTPIVVVAVKSGRLSFRLSHGEFSLGAGENRALYSNRGGEATALEPAVITLRIYDECF